MNSRQRLIAAVNHRQPDRIPVDLGGTSVTGISAIAYNKLVMHLAKGKPGRVDDTVQQTAYAGGLTGVTDVVREIAGAGKPERVYDLVQQLASAVRPARITDVVQQIANVEMEIVDLLGVDVLDTNRIYAEQADWYEVELDDGSRAEFPGWFRPERMPDSSWQLVDDEGIVQLRMIRGSSVFDQVFFPYENGYPADFRGFRDIMQLIPGIEHPFSSDVKAESLAEKVIALKNTTGKALTLSGGPGLLETGNSARRMENFLTDLLVNDVKVSAMLDMAMDLNMESLEHICNRFGDVADVICLGDDLGMKTGPLIDLETFRKFFKPRYKILCDYVKSHSDMKIFFHSCGSIREFIPDLIEVGIDILNPVQTDSGEMDAAVLKREFGRHITFWGGGPDASGVLNTGTPGEIRDDVMRRCEILSRDGGFVFAPVHNIMPEAPPQNILAAYKAVQEFSGTTFSAL